MDNSIIRDFDAMIDELVFSGYSIEFSNIRVPDSASSVEVYAALKLYKGVLEEIRLIGHDEQVTEAYSHLTIFARKNYEKLLTMIISALEFKVDSFRKKRKPRVKKLKSKEAAVKKLHYMVECPDLQIASVSPVHILDASVCWVFNTKTRLLTKYITKDASVLTIKGSTITNFCEQLSFSKKLRKPKEFLEMAKDKTSSQLNGIVSAIKSKPSKPTGRINKDTVILRVFK